MSHTMLQVIRPSHPAGQNGDDFNMRHPGALHHARFLMIAINILKLAMLFDVLPPGLLTPAMKPLIDRMAEYIAIFHIPWFLQALLPEPAPRLDLQLWHDMIAYEVKTKIITLIFIHLNQ